MHKVTQNENLKTVLWPKNILSFFGKNVWIEGLSSCEPIHHNDRTSRLSKKMGFAARRHAYWIFFRISIWAMFKCFFAKFCQTFCCFIFLSTQIINNKNNHISMRKMKYYSQSFIFTFHFIILVCSQFMYQSSIPFWVVTKLKGKERYIFLSFQLCFSFQKVSVFKSNLIFKEILKIIIKKIFIFWTFFTTRKLKSDRK